MPTAPKAFHPSLIGWIVFLWLAFILDKTKAGHVIIFYVLVLVLVFLFTGNASRIIKVVTKN